MQTNYTLKQVKENLAACTDSHAVFLQTLRNDERKSVQQLIKSWEQKQQKIKLRQEKFILMQQFERQAVKKGYQQIAGIDEVGRGPLAGPVVAAAVILPLQMPDIGLDDSKKIAATKRQKIFTDLQSHALGIGVGIVEPDIIDQINIYQATKLAMQQAITNLPIVADYLLIDAMQLDLTIPQEAIIKGDTKSLSIAAASIVAKETRDQIMADYHQVYPAFSFHRNAGYGTKEHLEALAKHGPTPIHRKSFAPVTDYFK